MRRKHFVGEEHVLALRERGRVYAMLEVNEADKRRMRWNRAQRLGSADCPDPTLYAYPKSLLSVLRVGKYHRGFKAGELHDLTLGKMTLAQGRAGSEIYLSQFNS